MIPALLIELGKLRCRRDETLLQAAVAACLSSLALAYSREHRLDGKNRIDFLVTGTEPGPFGIECKTAAGALGIARQLYRYADHLPHIILVTSWALPQIQSGIIRNSRNEPVRLDVVELWKNV